MTDIDYPRVSCALQRRAGLAVNGFALAAAMGVLGTASGEAATVATNLSQGTGLTSVTSFITNDDNAIFNSATFDLAGTYGAVLQGIKDHNPAFAGQTLNQIAGNVGITVRGEPTGEVNFGWNVGYAIATGRVTLTHNIGDPGFDYDQWNSNDADNDMMALTFNFGNMLDFNGNNVTDPNEQLVANGTFANGFVGFEGVFNYEADTPTFTFSNIPEPSASLLLGLGGLMLAMRRGR